MVEKANLLIQRRIKNVIEDVMDVCIAQTRFLAEPVAPLKEYQIKAIIERWPDAEAEMEKTINNFFMEDEEPYALKQSIVRDVGAVLNEASLSLTKFSFKTKIKELLMLRYKFDNHFFTNLVNIVNHEIRIQSVKFGIDQVRFQKAVNDKELQLVVGPFDSKEEEMSILFWTREQAGMEVVDEFLEAVRARQDLAIRSAVRDFKNLFEDALEF